MDAQSKVGSASKDAITYIKDAVVQDLVEAQRRGIVLKDVNKESLERLILLLRQSIDAAHQRQQPTFQRVIASVVEDARAEGAEASGRRKK